MPAQRTPVGVPPTPGQKTLMYASKPEPAAPAEVHEASEEDVTELADEVSGWEVLEPSRDTDLGQADSPPQAPTPTSDEERTDVIRATAEASARPRTAGSYSLSERPPAEPSGERAAAAPAPAAAPPPSPSRPEKRADAKAAHTEPPSSATTNPLDRELKARADRLKKDDPVGCAQAHVELGLLCEWMLSDRERAQRHYATARELVQTLAPALTRIRRIAGQASDALAVLDDEIAIAGTDEVRADLLGARARTLDAANNLTDARATYVEALKFQPRHPASLHGLASLLAREIGDGSKNLNAELAEHLGAVASAYMPDGTDGDANVAAWVCVERAEVLERQLKDVPNARESLKRGVALSPNPGPVRTALVRHLARHDRDTGLSEALRVESERETDPDRAARLLYTSARIALDRGGSRNDAVHALVRAEQRAPHGSFTQARVLDELLAQLEIDGDHTKLVEVRVKHLSLLKKREAIAYEYVRLADAYGRLGRADLAADAAARALSQDPANRAVREALDMSLQRLGRHADRVRSWLLEANSERPKRDRLRAFVRAADISVRHLSQAHQAIDALRGAWLLEPGNAAVFDALSALLRATPKAEGEAGSQAEQRIDLYEQAAALESDLERKIGLYEKVLAIWEDELDRPDKAIEVAERMLALDKKRRSAIVALGRNARRAGDGERLSKALLDEADQTGSAELKVRLLLEAAELADRKLERDRALSMVDRALSTKPGDVEAGRARVALLRKMNRLEEARKTLVALADHDKEGAFDTWLEVADLDESLRKAWGDAVDAYRNAHKERPDHPLPNIALVRLLRATKNWKRLVSELKLLARSEADPRALAALSATTGEVEEHCLGDDEAALKSYEACDEALQRGTEPSWDPGVFEAMERILFRVGDDEGLMRLYARWLERKPPANVDHGLRVGLASALEAASPAQAIEVLEALVSVVPNHVPALRKLERLQRARKNHQGLAATLLSEASVFGSRLARVGALWEIVTLEDKLGAATTLDALARITRESPHDIAALDTIIRIASRLVSNVGVPHPALLAARSQLLGALRARRELTIDPLARASYHLEEAMLLEGSEVERDPRAALDGYREALDLWPGSWLAARGLERLGTQLADAQAVITSQLALSKLTDSAVAKAAHLVRAAELIVTHQRDERTALELYEVALESDPDNKDAARALATMLAKDAHRLIERFRPALDRAGAPAQITLLGMEIAQSYLKIRDAEGEAARVDYGPGIQALRRAMRTQDDVPSLFLLSRLYSAQKAWAEAQGTLQRIVELSGGGTEAKNKQAALFALVDLYEGPLADAALAEAALVNVLATEPTNKPALERLYSLGVKNGDKKLARSSLERLADYETDLSQRTEYQLRVAEVCREANDGVGMLRAVSDAVVSTPQDMRPWTLLARLYRTDTTDGAAGLAHAIEQIIEMAKARRKPVEPRWLYTLGLLEVNMTKRLNEGLAHLQAAIGAASTPGSPAPHPELRAALGLGLLSAGRTKDAILVLRELCTAESDTLLRLNEPSVFSTVRNACVAATGTVLSSVLSCLDAALATEGRADERLAVEEVRALLSDIAVERANKLRQRRLEPEAPYANSLTPVELSRLLLPEARTPFIEVAVAIQPIVPKLLGFSLSSYGIGSREKIGPRDGHPSRAIADRVARALAVTEFEFYLSGSWTSPLRVIAGDPPAIVGPLNFPELPETEQVFAIARAMTKIALGTTWFDDVPAETVDGLLLSAMRAVFPNWGLGEINPQREHNLAASLPNMQRTIGRRQRKLLEERAANLSAALNPQSFVNAVKRSEYRAAYVMSGDLLGGLETMRKSEPELMRSAEPNLGNYRALLAFPMSNELIRFVLTQDAFNERRRTGALWGATG